MLKLSGVQLKSSKSGQKKKLTRREEQMEGEQKVKDVIMSGLAIGQGKRVEEEWRNASSCNVTTSELTIEGAF